MYKYYEKKDEYHALYIHNITRRFKNIIHFQMHGLLLPRIICLFMNLQLDSYRNIFNHIFHINFVYKVLHAHIPYLYIWYIQILINPTICMLMFQQTHLVIVFVYNVWNTMVTLLRIYDIGTRSNYVNVKGYLIARNNESIRFLILCKKGEIKSLKNYLEYFKRERNKRGNKVGKKCDFIDRRLEVLVEI